MKKSFEKGKVTLMNVEAIIRSWKADEGDDDDKDDDADKSKAPANPAGEELSDEELEEAQGGRMNPTISACKDETC